MNVVERLADEEPDIPLRRPEHSKKESKYWTSLSLPETQLQINANVSLKENNREFSLIQNVCGGLLHGPAHLYSED